MMDFQQAGSKFKQLKAQYKAGEITESEFKARLEDLMVQDETGTWWMIGYETEKWYRNDGEEWVQADPQAAMAQKTTRISNWKPVFWVVLGFALGWGIGGESIAVGLRMGFTPIFLITAWMIGWAIGGYVTGTTLYSEHVLTNRKSTLWITLSWGVSFLIGFAIGQSIISALGILPLSALGAVVGLIGGGTGGFLTARILRNEQVFSNQKSVIWTMLAWLIGGAIGGSIGLYVGPTIGGILNIPDPIGLPVGLAIGGAIAGGIGGLTTIYQIKNG